METDEVLKQVRGPRGQTEGPTRHATRGRVPLLRAAAASASMRPLAGADCGPQHGAEAPGKQVLGSNSDGQLFLS